MSTRTLTTLLMLYGMLVARTGSAQSWEVFDMNTAGLPSNTVRALAVAPNADVWVGTEFGLCRYDGNLWQTFQTGSSGLPDNDIRALAARVPGLNIETSNGRTQPRFYLRGLGNIDFDANANQPVAMIYDEISLESNT